MTDNQYKFMIRTGKYLPDEDIKFDGIIYNYKRYNEYIKCTYYENSNGYWYKRSYTEGDKCNLYENSKGFWFKQKFNNKNIKVYYENSDGYWEKMDDEGTLIEHGIHYIK